MEGANIAQRVFGSGAWPGYTAGGGQPGENGGGTIVSHDAGATQEQWESIFGPGARDIKFDKQAHKRDGRLHLPSVLEGVNHYLTDRIDGLITDATNSPFTTIILPYQYLPNPDAKFTWNRYSFDEGLASRVPYESAARTMAQTRRSYEGYTVRQGLAITMEHNFMMSPAGRENFFNKWWQVVGSIQKTNDLDVHIALLNAPTYAAEIRGKYYVSTKTTHQIIREHVDMFGFMQKNVNALDILIEEAKITLQQWGNALPPTFMLCNSKLTMQLTMNPERTNFITQGYDGIRRLKQGPMIPSYRDLSVVHSRQYSLETGAPPRDLLRRRVRVAEYYRIPWQPAFNTFENLGKVYVELYDESRDTFFRVSLEHLHRMASIKTDPDDLTSRSWSGKAFYTCGELKSFMKYSKEPDYVKLDKGSCVFCKFPSGENLWAVSDVFFGSKILKSELLTPEACEAALGKGPEHPTTISQMSTSIVHVICQRANTDAGDSMFEGIWKSDQRVLENLFNNQDWNFREIENALFAWTPEQINALVLFTQDRLVKNYLYTQGSPKGLPDDEDGTKYDAGVKKAYEILAGVKESCGHKKYTQIQDLQYFHALGQLIKLASDGKKESVVCFLDQTSEDLGYKGKEFKQWEIVIIRPNIEHNMLAAVLGRGGSEDLGSTFWGQTELSCYDDSMHGVWGMSYKYHERAIVTNERNLIRLFDVAYDGYNGGKDDTFVDWTDHTPLSQATITLDRPYDGPSMMVMAFPIDTKTAAHNQSWPSPIVFHDLASSRGEDPKANPQSYPLDPENVENITDSKMHVFTQAYNREDNALPAAWRDRYKKYYDLMPNFTYHHRNKKNAGHASSEGDACINSLAFQGTYRVGCTEPNLAGFVAMDVKGSGHHGVDYVGVASVRNGKGYKITGENLHAVRQV